jgi:hypothetical protein
VRRSVQDTLSFVRAAAGVFAGLAAFGSCAYLMMKMDVLAGAYWAGSYRPADFTVEWPVLSPDGDCYAVGTIDGRRERLGLRPLVAPPARQEELDRLVPGGRSIRVAYAPSATASSFNGATVRVMVWEDGFPGTLRRRALGVLVRAYAPLLVLSFVSVAASLALRRSWAPPLALAFFFLLFQLTAVAFVVGVEASSSGR